MDHRKEYLGTAANVSYWAFSDYIVNLDNLLFLSIKLFPPMRTELVLIFILFFSFIFYDLKLGLFVNDSFDGKHYEILVLTCYLIEKM